MCEGIELRHTDARVGSRNDAAATALLATETSAAFVAVDGYRFTAEFLLSLRNARQRVIFIDDTAHLAHYPVDLLLNQNLSATRAVYAAKIETSTCLLLGPRYGLLRREFRCVPPVRPPLNGRTKRVLVTFGGSDPLNFTAAVLGRFAKIRGDYVIRVLAGAANTNVRTLLSKAKQMPFPCEIVVDAENVAKHMEWADVAVSAAGSTVWELAAMRLPSLLGAISEDQRIIGPALRQIGGFRAWTIEELLKRDLKTEIEAVLAGTSDFGNFDALGALRVVEQLTHPPSLRESGA